MNCEASQGNNNANNNRESGSPFALPEFGNSSNNGNESPSDVLEIIEEALRIVADDDDDINSLQRYEARLFRTGPRPAFNNHGPSRQ
mmetsp:Transcript_31023/g.51656  ORF Transcript_31023/g.51656 Transcript_31023/m.51656 type:complete len:87 (+) Transcript_31023:471-731(+)